MSDDIKKGLLGIVVDETEISKVMPEINSLTYRGYAAQDLCARCDFLGICLRIFIKFLDKVLSFVSSFSNFFNSFLFGRSPFKIK